MKIALDDVKNSSSKNLSVDQMKEKLEKLRDAAQEYERSHNKWNMAFRKYGKDRLQASRNLVNFANQKLADLDKLSKGLSEYERTYKIDSLVIPTASWSHKANEAAKQRVAENTINENAKNEVKKPEKNKNANNEMQDPEKQNGKNRLLSFKDMENDPNLNKSEKNHIRQNVPKNPEKNLINNRHSVHQNVPKVSEMIYE